MDRWEPDRVYPRVCGGTHLCSKQGGEFQWVYPRVCGGTAL